MKRQFITCQPNLYLFSLSSQSSQTAGRIDQVGLICLKSDCLLTSILIEFAMSFQDESILHIIYYQYWQFVITFTQWILHFDSFHLFLWQSDYDYFLRCISRTEVLDWYILLHLPAKTADLRVCWVLTVEMQMHFTQHIKTWSTPNFAATCRRLGLWKSSSNNEVE